jgi:hypothetical protein
MSIGTIYLVMAAPFAAVGAVIVLGRTSQRRRAELLATTGHGAIGRVLAVGSSSDDLGGTRSGSRSSTTTTASLSPPPSSSASATRSGTG